MNADYRYKEHPKSCALDDVWGQVSRTVNGQPVSQDQIDLIVDAIRTALHPTLSDCVLDIGCGNGALASYLFDQMGGYLGVDHSEYLIGLAKQFFDSHGHVAFHVWDAVEYVQTEPAPERFTKALCYGTFSYFSHEAARGVLLGLSERFVRLESVFIGNLPEKSRARSFYRPDIDVDKTVDDCTTSIGIWRTEDEFRHLAHECGWSMTCLRMPTEFYGAHYRYDVLLTRPLQDCRGQVVQRSIFAGSAATPCESCQPVKIDL